MTCAVLGIDPGSSGGLAWVSDSNALAWKMPETERDLWELVRSLKVQSEFAVLELVNAKPGTDGEQGPEGKAPMRKMGAKGAMAFGENVGLCRMALTGNAIPYERVAPGRWQRAFRLPTLKECGGSSTTKKNAHKARAQELFPALKITHAIADALLIAEYERRRRAGMVAA